MKRLLWEIEAKYREQKKSYEEQIKKAAEVLASAKKVANELREKIYPSTIEGWQRLIEQTRKAAFLSLLDFEKA